MRLLASLIVLLLATTSATSQQPQQPDPNQTQLTPTYRGTEQAPFIVKTVPEEKSPEDAIVQIEKAKLDRKTVELTAQLVTYTWLLFLATGALAVGTIGIVVVAYSQMREARRSIVAAERGALAAERALTIVERAYIAVEGLGVEDLHAIAIARINIINAGNLPAQRIRWIIYAEIDADDEREIFDVSDDCILPSDNILAPRQEMPRFFLHGIFDPFEVMAFERGERVLYVWGIVYYIDGFQTWRWLRFCHRYNNDCVEERKEGGRIVWDVSPARVRQHQFGNRTDEYLTDDP